MPRAAVFRGHVVALLEETCEALDASLSLWLERLLRRRAGYAPRWRMPGVPAIPIVFAVVSFAIAFNQIRVDPINSIVGLGMVLVGLPVYLIWRKRVI